MKVLILLICYFFNIQKSLCSPSWLNITVNQMINEFQPYSAILWTVRLSGLQKNLTNVVVQEFSNHIPTVQIDAELSFKRKEKRSFELPVMKYPKSSISIILLNSGKEDVFMSELYHVLICTRSAAPSIPRPNTLIIVFGKKKYSTLQNAIQRMILRGFNMKFLHFTFIFINQKSSKPPVLIWYEAFDNLMKVKFINDKSVFFPIKLQDLKGENFTVADVGDNVKWKKEERSRFRIDFRVFLTPSNYVFMKYFFCQSHNCTVVVKKFDEKHPPDIRYGLYFWDFREMHSYTYGVCFKLAEFSAAIPHHDRAKIGLQRQYKNLVRFVAIVALIIIFLKMLVKILKLDQRQTRCLKLLTFILGSPMLTRSCTKDKVFYVILIFSSFFTSNILIDLALEFELEIVKISVNNISELLRLGVPIYSSQSKEFITINEIEELTYEDMVNNVCLIKLYENNDRICVDDDRQIRVISAKQKHVSRKRGFRITNFILTQSCLGSFFDLASFYVEEYDKIVLRSLEYGLLKRPLLKEELNALRLVVDEQDYDIVPNSEIDFYMSLFDILLVVHVLATLICMIEIIYYRTKPNLVAFFKLYLRRYSKK